MAFPVSTILPPKLPMKEADSVYTCGMYLLTQCSVRCVVLPVHNRSPQYCTLGYLRPSEAHWVGIINQIQSIGFVDYHKTGPFTVSRVD